MIRDVYITRIVDEGDGKRKFGFGVTEDEKNVYIPAYVISTFELSEDDVGTKNKMNLDFDKKGQTDFVAQTLLIEDSALQQAYEWATDEIERLEAILDAHQIQH